MNEYAERLKDHAARYLVGSPSDVTESDVFQEAYIRVMKQFRKGEFRGKTMEELRAYIFKTVRHLSVNWSRVNRREVNGIESNPEQILDTWRRLVTIPAVVQESPSEAASRREEEEFIQKAIESLRPINQQIYRLSMKPGITNEEIGQQVGLSAEAVRKTRERMLVLLKRWIRKRLRDNRGEGNSSS